NLPGGAESIELSSATFNLFTAFPSGGEFPVSQRSFIADKTPTLETLTYTSDQKFFVDDPQTPFELYATNDDFEFMEQVTFLTFSILLAITARPMLIETGRRQGKHKKSG